MCSTLLSQPTKYAGSTVIADTYEFHSLADWERFYLSNKAAIDAKDTRWLNHHITISDNGKYYKIKYVKKKLYLKPYIRIDPKTEKDDALVHSLDLILEKLQELYDGIKAPHSADGGDSTSSLPHKSVIERVKTVPLDKA